MTTTGQRARTGRCFYCGRPVCAHIAARIEHHYKHGGSRVSYRLFHEACFVKFEMHGRPLNPHTEYTVLDSEWRSGYVEEESEEN